jgi:hypothetical protein
MIIKILSFFYCIILVFFVPVYIMNSYYHFHFYPYNSFPPLLKSQLFTLISPTDGIFYLQKNQFYKISLQNPYIGYDPHGFVVNYNNQGTQITLYKETYITLKRNNSYTYPRIAYPFLLFFNQDLTSVEVTLIDSPTHTIKIVQGGDIFTSWSSSPNGNYLILANLSGEVFIFDKKNLKWSSHFPKNYGNCFVQSAGITDDGLFFTVGNTPKILSYGNVHTFKKTFETIPLTNTSTTRQTPFITDNFILFPDKTGFELLKYNNEKITKQKFLLYKPYSVFLAKELSHKRLLIGYFVSENLYVFDVMDENQNFLYSYSMESSILPIYSKIKNKDYLIAEMGAFLL